MDKPPKSALSGINFSSETETGWDRLKLMFTPDENGFPSKELMFSWNGAHFGFFSGAFIGVLDAAKIVRDDFIKKNQESIYTHQYMAKRSYYDHLIREMMKHGWKWGWRTALLVGSIMTMCTTLSVYRNRIAVQDFTIAGATTGSLWRWNRGVRACFAGGVLGGSLGTVAGAVVFTGLWATGNSVAEMRYWGHNQYIADIQKKKEEMKAKKLKEEKEAGDEECVKLLRWHQEHHKEAGQETTAAK